MEKNKETKKAKKTGQKDVFTTPRSGDFSVSTIASSHKALVGFMRHQNPRPSWLDF